MDNKKKIRVTRPDLPELSDFFNEMEELWDSGWLTNMGRYHNLLEIELQNYLGVRYISLFSNGTIALMTALKALGIKGEVITTPYSFVATANSIVWNGLKPVFIDILPENGNMDFSQIEQAITANTSAIMPVHVYGNPCEVESIKEIADRYGLKVIYDAAHAFGVKKDGISVLTYGDLSVLSFHATKVFHTVEGGAIICHTKEMKVKLDQLKNFGYDDKDQINSIGINGKLNELQAIMGLLNLRDIQVKIKRRKEITELYDEAIDNIDGIRNIIKDQSKTIEYNYSYYPIFVENNYVSTRDELFNEFEAKGIYPRKYFFPLISNFNIYHKYPSADKTNLINANIIADQVLCLPLYPVLTDEEVFKVIDILKRKK